MRPCVDVDALDGLGARPRAGRHRAHVGRGQPRRLRGLGELAAELAEDEVLAAVLDEAEGGGIPERGGATVAQHDLVPLGQREQLREVLAHAADEVLHRRLAVRGAEHGCAVGHQRFQLGSTHFRRAAAESSVGGQKVTGELDVRHGTSLRFPSAAAERLRRATGRRRRPPAAGRCARRDADAPSGRLRARRSPHDGRRRHPSPVPGAEGRLRCAAAPWPRARRAQG